MTKWSPDDGRDNKNGGLSLEPSHSPIGPPQRIDSRKIASFPTRTMEASTGLLLADTTKPHGPNDDEEEGYDISRVASIPGAHAITPFSSIVSENPSNNNNNSSNNNNIANINTMSPNSSTSREGIRDPVLVHASVVEPEPTPVLQATLIPEPPKKPQEQPSTPSQSSDTSKRHKIMVVASIVCLAISILVLAISLIVPLSNNGGNEQSNNKSESQTIPSMAPINSTPPTRPSTTISSTPSASSNLDHNDHPTIPPFTFPSISPSTTFPTVPPTKHPTAIPTIAPSPKPSFRPSTSHPTVSPTVSIKSILSPLSLDDGIALQTPGTPQYQAAAWLEGTQNWSLLPMKRLKQRFALSSFYFAAMGDSWLNNDNWLSENKHECLWHGVHCDNKLGVEQISLPYNNLGGSLVPEIGYLTNLMTMDMCCGNLAGTIPTELGLLTNLQALNFELTSVSGSLPTELGNLVDLTMVDFESTSISGRIPSELGYLSKLSKLDFGVTDLTGSVPRQICNLRRRGAIETFYTDCELDCNCCSICW